MANYYLLTLHETPAGFQETFRVPHVESAEQVMTDTTETQTYESMAHHDSRRKWLLSILKIVAVVVVLCALGKQIGVLINEWSDKGPDLHKLIGSVDGIILAAVAYVAAQVCFATFWGRLLNRAGAKSSWFDVLRAYSLGTLGKYVPGKALVIIVRSALLSNPTISRLWIGIAVVYETVAMMAVAGMVATLCLLLVHPDQWLLWGGAAVLAIGATAMLHPAMVGRIARLAASPFGQLTDDFPLARWNTALIRWGALEIGGWALAGISFVQAARVAGIECGSPGDWAVMTGTVALATAAGFLVVFMPAGVGVRELIIIHVLGPRYGVSQVVLASLVLRVIWTVAEASLAGLLYGATPVVRRLNRSATSKTA